MTEKIARYEIISELGKGAMGRVYLAHDPNIDRKVALKVVLPTGDLPVEEQQEFSKRFVLEARAAGRLSHAGIVPVFDAGEDKERQIPYIAMEYIDGWPLSKFLKEKGPLSIAQAVRVVSQVARALDYAHSEGIVHRDIKPENILLTNRGQAKITDFGIAKLTSENHTMAGRILGTPKYMSPEQLRADTVDGRSDLFSLGGVLYQCLTAEAPFGGDSLGNITIRILTTEPAPVESLNPAVTPALRSVIDRALKKSPDERFQTGEEFAKALAAAARGKALPTAVAKDVEGAGGTVMATTVVTPEMTSPTVVTTRPAPASGKMVPLLIGLGVAVLVLAGLLAFFLMRDPETPSETVAAAAAVPTPTPPSPAGAVLPPAPSPTDGPSAEDGDPAADGDASEEDGESEGEESTEDDGSAVGPDGLADGETDEEALMEEGTPSIGPPPEEVQAQIERRRRQQEARRLAAAATAAAAAAARAEASEAPAAPAAAVAVSTFDVVYENRLKSGKIALSVDGKERWSAPLSAHKNPFKRMAGKEMRTTVELPDGRYEIEVRITSKKTDVREQIEGRLIGGETRTLRVRFNPATDRLKLAWED